jgi:hypothetical protein
VISEASLTLEALSGFAIVIVPDVRHLAAEAAAAVTEYVRGGGGLLFTHQTATASPTAMSPPAPGFGLVEITAPLPHPASFLKPAFPLSSTHLRVAETLAFRAQGDIRVLATHVAPNIAVTAERWVSHNVAPGAETGQPSVIAGQHGAGRYVYCAPRLFAEYVRQGLPALREFLAHLLGQLAAPAIRVEAPAIVEATFSCQRDDLVVCLVNGVTGKPALGGFLLLRDAPGHDALDEVIPIRDVRIHVRGRPIASACDGRGRPLPVMRSENESTITLERLDEYAVVRLNR